ncbi:MAG: iron-containing alcohol dehydrogenase [Firmicutes bacterium]|nr:iron-containing alcohol dehydrogenase [Bacillota bacterium]
MKTSNSFVFNVPTKALVGPGKLNDLHKEINTYNGAITGTKAMVVISNGKSVRKNGYLGRVEEQLKLAGVDYVIFDRIGANPVIAMIEDGRQFCLENGCDFIVALGGGSVIDAAKHISMLATNDGSIWDYAQGGTGGKKNPENRALQSVAIPTTAGTGSETDAGGVVTNVETNEKIGIKGKGTAPELAIVDAELMMSVPKDFKAYQGFDAVFHSTESILTHKLNAVSKMIACEAIYTVCHNLERAVNDPEDVEAMQAVAYGSYLSGMGMMTGLLTGAHGIEQSMSGRYGDLPHGAGLIMICKQYYQYFIDHHACDDKFVEMARLMGADGTDDPQDFIRMMEKMEKECGVDQLKMTDYGMDPSTFEDIVRIAFDSTPWLFDNDPIEMDRAAYLKMMMDAYK